MSALRARLRPIYCAKRLLFQSDLASKCVATTSFATQRQYNFPPAGLVFHRSYSAATEEKESEKLKDAQEKQTEKNNDTPEQLKGTSEKREFQAETRMLLDIVARSLYSDKEVFIRELISNASDALEKFRYLSVSGVADAPKLDQVDRSLEIHISTNKQNRTIIIQDSGIGMTKEELTDNLGTIARSGSKSFIEELKNKGSDDANAIIGQFGVGFYSAFMVADKIEVFTRSSKTGSPGYKWKSDGSGVYEIQEAEGVAIGTKIVIYLKPECREFADDNTVEKIITKYSNFIGSPIYLNDVQVNSIKPLWLMDPKEVTKEDHIEFYKFISNAYDKPRFTLHYKTDAPLSIRSIIYVPEGKPGLFEISRDTKEVGVALYSRKILIKSKADNLLPKWMRFVKGVVDSEDIPLNLSRELLQNSALITKLKTVLTNRFLKFMVEMANKDPVGYDLFHKEYSLFMKEGIVTSQSPLEREEIAKLLRFESSKLESGQKTSLADYGARQKADQRNIYYLAAPSRELAETSPYYESLKKRDVEVLFCYEPYDELVLLELKEFGGRTLTSVENELEKDEPDSSAIIGSDSLQKSESDELIKYLQTKLTGRVFEIRTTRKLDSYPCVIIVPEMAAARHFVRTQAANLSEENRYSLLRPQLELNPKHPIIKKLHKLLTTDKELADMLTQQLFTNAMVTAGLIMDPRNLISGINELLVKALDKH